MTVGTTCPNARAVPTAAGPVSITVRAALVAARSRLATAVTTSPDPEAAELLATVLGVERSRLGLEQSRELSAKQARKLESMLERRAAGEPLQYITGKAGFRGLDVEVGAGALVPRPETEVVAGRAIEFLNRMGRKALAVDIGTGSGCIALALAREVADCEVWATEISVQACGWAERNLAGQPRVHLAAGDLYEPLPAELRGAVDVVVANPPYFSADQLASLPVDVREHEPFVALVSPGGGMALALRVIEGAAIWLRPGGLLVVEMAEGQGPVLVEALRRNGFAAARTGRDLAGRDRFVEGVLRRE
ncbi:MAG: peptide chain release factor N(5)-glutamine methyltransferase [Actinomycetota bacterium]